MKAIIMAGGEGTRLRPLTCDRPKPMVPVGNRPVMEYAIELLKKLNITEIGVTLQYLPEHISNYFGDGNQWGVNLHYFIEDTPLGTAGSVKNAGDFLDETFLVVSGDALTDLNLSKAIDFHRQNKAIGTLALTSVTNPLEYGVVITNPDGSIQRFLEKPGWGEVFSDWVNTGIYILEPEALEYFNAGQKYDFSKDLFPQLLNNNEPLYGCLLEGYWCDIGNLEQYIQSHRDILDGKVNVNPRGTLIQGVFQGGKLEGIKGQVNIKGPVLIGENCRLASGIKLEPYTVLGDNVILEKDASLKRSILWNNVYIGNNASIRGAVIGNKVTVGHNASILQDAAIGDSTNIDPRSTINPQVKIWPCKSVSTGAVVSESLVWGEQANKLLFGVEGIPGLTNWDITPELAAKLGASYGSVVNKKSQIAVSCDGRPVTKMLKASFESGLLSTGIKVTDLGELTMPIHRFAVRSLGVTGGVHIKTDHNNPNKCWIQFVDSKGININRDMERKIEGMYLREDFRRVEEHLIEDTNKMPHFVSSYMDSLLNKIDIEKIRSKKFKLLLNTNGSVINNIFKELANRLNFQIEFFKDNDQDKGYNEQLKLTDQISKSMTQRLCDFGGIIDSNGERIVLIDDENRVINEHLFTVLQTLLIFKANNGGAVAVPITASETIEQIADKYNARVIRAKTAPWAVMKEFLKDEVANSQKHYPQFLMQDDAVYSIIMLMDFMSKENLKLADLVDEIPDINLKVKTAECPWEEKGRIMRALINEVKEQPIELLDGVKIRHDNGWALVLPHSEKPQYRIYSEGISPEIAEELGVFYQNKIDQMLQN